MKSLYRTIVGIIGVMVLIGSSYATQAAKNHVLVISITKGFAHSSVPTGEAVFKKLGDESGLWQVDYARTDEELAEKTTPEALKKYSVLIFNNTTGDLPLADKQAFLEWVKAGGGVVGIHAATDTFHGWPEFIEMMGAEFTGHGPQSEVEFIVEDPGHPVTAGMPKTFKFTEEIYLFKNFSRGAVRTLISLNKHPNTGEPGDYPISWVRKYGNGRVFYTSLGHREDVLKKQIVQKHLLNGMRWVLGLAEGSAVPRSPISPLEEEQGFRPLFNGRDLTGWQLRSNDRTPWTVKDGVMSVGHGGSDIYTESKFTDFILRYEYRIPPGGNSGVYLHGRYEIQILDDFQSGSPSLHGNGSIYGKIAPSKFASKPAGEWQTVQAMLVGNRVTVILNGETIIDGQEIEGPSGGALDSDESAPGPIMLQGDHGPIEYRCIRIKEL